MDSYKAAGVDVAAADRFVRSIGESVTASWGSNVVGGFGGFAAGLTIPPGYSNPVLMMSTDGVGTKLELARQLNNYSGVGYDLVAMCVDDLAAVGSTAIGFTDYIAVGQLDPVREKIVVESIAAACTSIGCALLGGETAEHPGVVDSDHLDVAGAALGVVESGSQVTGADIAPGDTVIGIPSPNVRSNGFSLVRKIVQDYSTLVDGGRTIGEVLLEPSIIYSPAVLSVVAAGLATGLAHITGGGLPGNAGRPLPEGLSAHIDTATWQPPSVFDYLAETGQISTSAMFQTFNMGIGFIVICRPDHATEVNDILSESGHAACEIGSITENGDHVQLF